MGNTPAKVSGFTLYNNTYIEEDAKGIREVDCEAMDLESALKYAAAHKNIDSFCFKAAKFDSSTPVECLFFKGGTNEAQRGSEDGQNWYTYVKQDSNTVELMGIADCSCTWNEFKTNTAGLGFDQAELGAIWKRRDTSDEPLEDEPPLSLNLSTDSAPDVIFGGKKGTAVDDDGGLESRLQTALDKSTTWNEFKTNSAGLGIEQAELGAMWKEHNNREDPLSSILELSSTWNEFKTNTAGLGMDQAELGAMWKTFLNMEHLKEALASSDTWAEFETSTKGLSFSASVDLQDVWTTKAGSTADNYTDFRRMTAKMGLSQADLGAAWKKAQGDCR